jgi:hypothetical protein
MTAPNLLNGEFNRFYTSSAKENGWINTKKQGVYVLQQRWRDILEMYKIEATKIIDTIKPAVIDSFDAKGGFKSPAVLLKELRQK